MKLVMPFLLFSFSLNVSAQKVSSYNEMLVTKKEGKDFEIKVRAGLQASLVMAIHGGTIESGTTELAEAIAGKKFSFYSFSGLTSDYQGLHLTSTDFDEPKLTLLTQQAPKCLSLHGLIDNKVDFCVGGAHVKKRQAYVQLLSKKFPEWRTCELCCPPNSGTSKNNVVNRCQTLGVQIEMGQHLRAKLLQNPALLKELSHVLRKQLSIN